MGSPIARRSTMGVGEAADNKASDAVKAVVVNFMLTGRDSWMDRVCVSQELVLELWNTSNRRRAHHIVHIDCETSPNPIVSITIISP